MCKHEQWSAEAESEVQEEGAKCILSWWQKVSVLVHIRRAGEREFQIVWTATLKLWVPNEAQITWDNEWNDDYAKLNVMLAMLSTALFHKQWIYSNTFVNFFTRTRALS